MKYFRFAGVFLVVAVFSAAGPALAGPWPEGLQEKAQEHIASLQEEQDAIRESTLGELRGVVPMTAFDRESHNCHEVAGQSYRVYGSPRYAGEADRGLHLVRVVFEVYYRQADRVRDLMDQEWQQGSDGGVRITFGQADGEWQAKEVKELLTMDR